MDEIKKLERIKVVGKGHLDPGLLTEKDWNKPDISGWLIKEGAVNRSLKKRWFVLQGNKMMYFKSDTNRKLIGHFILSTEDKVAALPNKDMYNKTCKIHKWRIATPLRTWKLISDSLEEMKNWIHAISKVIIPTYTFGMSLSAIVDREEETAISTIRVPMIVQRCIQFLRDNGGSDAEGIFRLSGEGPKIKELRKAFNYQYPHHVSLDGADSLHNVANVLKVFLRELQDSLVPKMYYEDIKKLISEDDISFVKLELKKKLQTFPECNFQTLKLIFNYLKEVEAQCEHNKMTGVNISLVFGPCLIHSKDQLSALADTTYQCGLAKIFLDHFNFLFNDVKDENEVNEKFQNSLNEELQGIQSILNEEFKGKQSQLTSELKSKQSVSMRPRSKVIRSENNMVPNEVTHPSSKDYEENIIVVNSIDDITFLEDEDGIIDLSNLKL